MIWLQLLTIAALFCLAGWCALGLDDTNHDVTHRGNR